MFDSKKLAASCAAVASLAMFGLSGTAMAVETPTTSDTATASITLNAAEGNTLAGHTFTFYRLGSYGDITAGTSGTDVKSLTVNKIDDAGLVFVCALWLCDAFDLVDEQMKSMACGGDALRRLVGQLPQGVAVVVRFKGQRAIVAIPFSFSQVQVGVSEKPLTVGLAPLGIAQFETDRPIGGSADLILVRLCAGNLRGDVYSLTVRPFDTVRLALMTIEP